MVFELFKGEIPAYYLYMNISVCIEKWLVDTHKRRPERTEALYYYCNRIIMTMNQAARMSGW